jgi:hypothetical protein
LRRGSSMANDSKAHLPLAQWEQIKHDQYETDKQFWPQIQAMQVSKMGILLGLSILAKPQPPPPQLPLKLFALLGRYAISLFECEYMQYPKSQERFAWAFDLFEKTTRLVMDKVAQLEAGLSAGLTHHATYAEMQVAVRKSLQDHIQDLPKPPAPIVYLPVPPIDNDRVEASSALPVRGAAPTKSLAERLDDAAIDTGHEELAHRIGVSRSSYFEVKRGGGGRKARKKVEGYLRILEAPKTDSD